MRPEVTERRVAMLLSRVVFPAPLGPSRPTISPWRIETDTFRRARRGFFIEYRRPSQRRCGYSLDTFSTETAMAFDRPPAAADPVTVAMDSEAIVHRTTVRARMLP